ncbi:MAG: hypothetical protein KC609_21025 [Myxococcales bacterium]|nr:hypothetical protein [Myxococcales bacterium]
MQITLVTEFVRFGSIYRGVALTNDAQPSEVAFHFLKSANYRTVHADGVWGGIAPNLTIQMHFYSERLPIPQKVVHSFESGVLGGEIQEKREGKSGLVREVEVGVTMNVAQAEALISWLREKIDLVRDLEKGAKHGTD